MARIRSVHPGLFTDEDFVSLSGHARLLLIGLWTECDDLGAFEWKPVGLKIRLFPADAVDCGELLAEIERAGFIRRYEVGGRHFGAVKWWAEYQRPKKPTARFPMPAEIKAFAGKKPKSDHVNDDEFPSDGEPVPNQFPTGGGKPPQMEGRVEGSVGEKKNPESEKAPSRARTKAAGHGIAWPVSETPGPWAALEAETRGLAAALVPEVWQSWRDHRMANGIAPADPVADWRRWCSTEVQRRRQQGTGPPARQQQATGETLAERARRIAETTERRMAGGGT